MAPPDSQNQRIGGVPDAEFLAQFINCCRKSINNERLCFAHDFPVRCNEAAGPLEGKKTRGCGRGNANSRSVSQSRQGNGKCQTAEFRGLEALMPMSAWSRCTSHRSQHGRSTTEARKHENRCHSRLLWVDCEWRHGTRHWLINKHAISLADVAQDFVAKEQHYFR